MRTLPLSAITDSIDYGVTASASFETVGPKFLRITDIQNGSVNWDTVPFCEGDQQKLKSSRLRAGDIVFARTGATTGKSFLIRSCPPEAVFASYLIRVRPSRDVDPLFLSYYFDSPDYWNQIALKRVGAAQPGVNSSKLKELEVPLPPLLEQRRIAAILDQADGLRRKRRGALELLQGLPAAIFNEMFGDPSLPANGLLRAPLGEVAKLINGDRSSNYPSGDDLVETGILFLSTKNINGSEIDTSTCNFITTRKFQSLSQGKLERHDLVITLRGTIGQCAEFDCNYDTGFINAQMMIIRPGRRVRSKYLREFIMHPRTQSLFKRDSSGSAVPQLTGKQIGKLLIPLPTERAQEFFSAKLVAVREAASASIRHLEKLDALFASLQHRAFSGELTSKQAERELAMAG